MAVQEGLIPATELAERAGVRFPNESEEYRQARTALLAEEIELRRHIERVAEQRRKLPPGGEVTTGNYRFKDTLGVRNFSELFDGKQTLAIYSFMYGPERERPCPMCTSLLGSWDGVAPDVEQRIALAIVGRSPLSRLTDFAKERGWRHLKFYSDLNDQYSYDYKALTDKGEDVAAFHVFTHRDGVIRHFWGAEMTMETADPGQDPRGAPDLMPLWTILDCTPEGRGRDWYPKLSYE